MNSLKKIHVHPKNIIWAVNKITIRLAMMLIACIATAQKKSEAGYNEHLAIDVVQQFVNAAVAGDKLKMAPYLTEDFKAFNGSTANMNDKGMDKEAFLNQMVHNIQFDDYDIESLPEPFPDALEFLKDNPGGVIWVQSRDVTKDAHKITGVKFDAASHRLYTIIRNNKIKNIIYYNNGRVIDEIRASFADMTNGTIYNNHQNINTVRELMHALEKNDLDMAYSFYDKDVKFLDSGSPNFEGISLREHKAIDKKLLETFNIASIIMVGNPDYLHYKMEDERVVQSLWNINFIRKSDKKHISIPFHYQMYFNKEGKIISQTAYYSPKLLD